MSIAWYRSSFNVFNCKMISTGMRLSIICFANYLHTLICACTLGLIISLDSVSSSNNAFQVLM